MASADSATATNQSRQVVRALVKRTGLNRLRWARKARTVRRYGGRPTDHLSYVLFDPETENFTYEIENRGELSAWLDELLGAGKYVMELERDAILEQELRSRLRWRPARKNDVLFGRRLGWYAIVRALRPRRVVETGTHDGLGSTALLAALERNELGELISIDPKPGAGWLVPDRLRTRWQPLRGTSYAKLESVGPIDLFVHDSLHTEECERWELETAAQLGAAVLLSDNAHASDTCREFAADIGAEFSLWGERVAGHFYPGGAIGVVMRHDNTRSDRSA